MFMVKALANGFYRNIYRFRNDRFRVDSEAEFSKRWMEKLSEDEMKKTAKEEKAIQDANDAKIAERKAEREERAEARATDRKTAASLKADVEEKKAEAELKKLQDKADALEKAKAKLKKSGKNKK